MKTRLGDNFLKLRQGNITEGVYAAKFETLSMCFRLFKKGVDEVYMCNFFQKELKFKIQDSVVPLRIQCFQPLVKKRIDVEDMKKSRENCRTVQNSEGPSRPYFLNHRRGKQYVRSYQRPKYNNRGS